MSQNNGKIRRAQRKEGAMERAAAHVHGPTCKKNRKAIAK